MYEREPKMSNYLNKLSFIGSILVVAIFTISIPITSLGAGTNTAAAMEQLGKRLFFDATLSNPNGSQSCASCHDPFVNFTASDEEVNRNGVAMPGAINTRFGPRKVPTATYSTLIGANFWDGRASGDTVTERIFPDQWNDKVKALMAALDSGAADQAMGPFLNPVEMNLANAAELCMRVAASSYVDLWEGVWGEPINCDDTEVIPASDGLEALTSADLVHQRIAFSINVFEHTLNTFSSFRDEALKKDKDGAFPLDRFTTAQNNGHDWYYDARVDDPTANRPRSITNNQCAGFCHSSSFRADGTDPDELYAPQGRAGFFNIGVPRNPKNSFYTMPVEFNPDGFDFVDLGLGGVDGDPRHEGEMKIPTMRNLVAEGFNKDYFHNGFFKSLKQVIHFYNTRDMKDVCVGDFDELTVEYAINHDCWPVAEVEITSDDTTNIFDCGNRVDRNTEHCKVPLDTANGETFDNWCDNEDANGQIRRPTEGVRASRELDIGNLCLTDTQENEIVEYLSTLTDKRLIRPVEIE